MFTCCASKPSVNKLAMGPRQKSDSSDDEAMSQYDLVLHLMTKEDRIIQQICTGYAEFDRHYTKSFHNCRTLSLHLNAESPQALARLVLRHKNAFQHCIYLNIAKFPGGFIVQTIKQFSFHSE